MSYNYDPELAHMAELIPYSELTDPVTSRVEMGKMIEKLGGELDTSGVNIEDRQIPGPDGNEINVRIYTPNNLNAETAGILHIHGGGFVVGDLDSEHGTNVADCRELGVVLVSVDYRLAPEYPFPAGLNDCYSALQWMTAHAAQLSVNTDRIAISGMSAGGGLSAALALKARDAGGPPICFQYLGIPELDDRLDTPSMQQFTDTPMWHRTNALLSWNYYLGSDYVRGGDNVPYLAAPARADDLAGLPPAYISTMEFDPLRDEGLIYGLRLLQAGVPAEIHNFPGTFHGSSLVQEAKVSKRERRERVAVLRRALDL